MGVQMKQCPICGQRYLSTRRHRCTDTSPHMGWGRAAARGAGVLAALSLLAIIGWMLTHRRGTPVTAPVPRQELHPWWNLSEQQVDRHFEEGRRGKRQGLPEPRRFLCPTNKDMDELITVEQVVLGALPLELRCEGWDCERNMLSDEAAAAKKEGTLAPFGGTVAVFAVHLCSKLTATPFTEGRFSFALETDAGRRVTPLRTPVGSTPEAYGHMSGPLYEKWRCSYVVEFPVRDSQGVPYIAGSTEWVRLWIIGKKRKISVRLWLDESCKWDATHPEPA